MQIRVLNDEESKDAEPTESETDDVFLRKIEATLLTQVRTPCLPPKRALCAYCYFVTIPFMHVHVQPSDFGTVVRQPARTVALP